MKLAHGLLLGLLALLAAAPAAACDLDCTLDRELRSQGLVGAVYALVEGDNTRIGAAGLANAVTRQPLRADSKVHIGSVTKTMLALGVLRLATQNRVDLDAPLADLLPQLPLDNPWHATRPVTLRHLLDHTAGLDDLRLWQFFTLRVSPRAPLADAFAHPKDLLRIRVEPGTRFSYSNMGYTLAGMVLEEITGERYESWLDRELLQPLHMSDSTFEFVGQAGPRADARLAWGHFDDQSLAEAQPVWLRPAAQFTTTAADMARVAKFLLSDGRIGGAPFIDDALLRQMGGARTDAASAGLGVGYALGLTTRDRHGAVGRCHSGNIIGFRAMLCIYPQERAAFFIAQNSDSETAQYTRFDELMIRELGVATPGPPVYSNAPSPAAWQGRYVPAPSRFETFRYLDLLFDSVEVRSDGAYLVLQRWGAEPLRLEPVGSRLYRAPDRQWASHVLMARDQELFIGEGTRTLRKIGAPVLALNRLSLVLGLAGLTTLMFLIPWRAWRRGEPWLQPASLALMLLLAPLPLFALQPFLALGDLTPASAALFIASCALSLLIAGHAIWAARARLPSWPVHVIASVLVLQWCATLFAWDLMPFATWR